MPRISSGVFSRLGLFAVACAVGDVVTSVRSSDPVEWCPRAGLEAELEASQLQGSPPVFKCPPPVGKWIHASDLVAMPLPGHSDVFLTLYRRHLFGNNHPSFAFIQLHGALLDGDYYFRQAIKAASLVVNNKSHATRGKSAVVIAPQFGDHPCSRAQWLGNSQLKGTARWHASSWFYGTKSFREPGWHSALEALDEVVHWAEEQYTRLERIIVLGFSAGGMLALRWATLSTVGGNGTTSRGTPLQLIVGSPSSELYVNDARPARSCVRQSSSSDPRFFCQKYQVPLNSSHRPETCGGTWNSYPFGLDGIDEFIERPYVGNAGAADLRLRLAGKDLWLGVGDRDTVPCTIGGCQCECPALDMGATRLQRLLNYVHHVEDVIPGYRAKYQIFAGGHAYYHMLCGQTARPEASTSFFENAFHRRATAQDHFTCSMKVERQGLNGNALAQKVAASAAECCSFCDADHACRAWTFAAKWLQCQLLADVSSHWSTADFVSGHKDQSDLFVV